MSQLALTQELPWVEAEYPGIPYPEPRPIIERPLPPAQQTPMVNVAPVTQRPVVNVAPVATQRNVQGYPAQMAPVVRERAVNNPYYNPQGSVALAAAGGPPPTMHQTDPYATAAWAYDPQGRPHALIGFPSRYPHVVHAGWTDTAAPYLAWAQNAAALGAARRAGVGPGSVQFPTPQAATAPAAPAALAVQAPPMAVSHTRATSRGFQQSPPPAGPIRETAPSTTAPTAPTPPALVRTAPMGAIDSPTGVAPDDTNLGYEDWREQNQTHAPWMSGLLGTVDDPAVSPSAENLSAATGGAIEDLLRQEGLSDLLHPLSESVLAQDALPYVDLNELYQQPDIASALAAEVIRARGGVAPRMFEQYLEDMGYVVPPRAPVTIPQTNPAPVWTPTLAR